MALVAQVLGESGVQFVAKERDRTFGEFIRGLREERSIGQRQLARVLGISPSYLNDIEKNKRLAPRTEIIQAIAEILQANPNEIFDLAGKSKNSVPPDIAEIIRGTPEIISLLRTMNEHGLADLEIRRIEENMAATNAKAIIIAAGMGSRLKEYTEDLPKCMLKFGKKTLLRRQLDAYKECGIGNISIIRGYKEEKINYKNIKYYKNPEYEKNNILNSLFYAEEEISDNVIISYSDILFESSVARRLLESESDISIVVDIDWRGYYEGREQHPIEEAENVIFDANNNVVEIGKILTDKHDVHGEFIGMMKFTPRGADIFKRHFHRAKALFWGKPFQRASTFERAYLTDLIQEMVDLGVPVHCVIIERGWKEIDTIEDYENALREFAE
jgi:phosphoenolpyruvate phosphomutase